MLMKTKIPNIVFLALVVLGAFSLIVMGITGAQQDKGFQSDFSTYQLGNSKLGAGQYIQAESLFSNLLDTHPTNHLLMWDMALSLAGQGKFTQSANYFAKAQAKRPFLVNNPNFLQQYGSVLSRIGQSDLAAKYLQRANQLQAAAPQK